MNNRPSPPKLLLAFFRWFCHSDYLEDIEGDLLERFKITAQDKGLTRAKWMFLFEVVKLLRPGITKSPKFIYSFNPGHLVQNDIKIAARNLRKHKTYVLINMLGMGFALACCLVSFLNLDYKLRFDEHHQAKADDVYRVNAIRVTPDGRESWGLSPVALGIVIEDEVPGISKVARLNVGNAIVRSNDKAFSEKVHFADLSLLQMLNFPLLYGSSSQFVSKDVVVMSQQTAQKYFGETNPVGREVELFVGDKKYPFTVGAVIEKVPENTSVLFDVMVPFDRFYDEQINWRDAQQITIFTELARDVECTTVGKTLTKYVSYVNQLGEQDYTTEQFYLQPYSELALTSDIDLPNWVRGRMLNRNAVGFLVGVTSILSFLILITASFNFTNTAIAFSGNRLMEIGIRKVIGGTRTQLIGQLLVENILLCLVSVVMAFVIGYYLIEGYNGLFEQSLDLRYAFKPRVLLFVIGFPLTVGLLAGIYPSIKISKYQPIKILKGKTNFMKMGWLPKMLLIGQFSMACFAIIGAIVMTQNAAYQQNLDFGYQLHQVNVVSMGGGGTPEKYISELEKLPEISGLAGSAQIIGQSSAVTVKNGMDDTGMPAQQLRVGVDYLDAVGMDLIHGRSFIGDNDWRSVIINQKMAAELGDSDPLGKTIYVEDSLFTIIGVVRNHKEFGLTQEEPACVFSYVPISEYGYVSVNAVKPSNEIVALLEQQWYQLNPNQPFSGFEQSMLIYKQLHINLIIRNLCLFLAIATLIMSVAGFYSIISLSVQKRTKEVGIRKVFGANVQHMIGLILKDFVAYVLVAFLVGSLLGLLLIKGVLFGQFYTYHMDLGLFSFALALMVMLSVPGLTVGFKVFRAASANPVNTLRDE